MPKKTVYLDYAAATPLDSEVLKAMLPFLSERFYNPSADYMQAREVRRALNDARARLAHWLGTNQNEIVFTAGGTEANNLAINGVMDSFPGANLLISSIEHESVRNPAASFSYKEIPVDPDGRIDPEDIKRLVNDQTVLISVIYANNEIGVVEPLKKLSAVISEIKRDRKKRAVAMPLLLHTDACQAANYLDLHVSRLGVDLMTLNGGKVYGPKQSGALYVSRQVKLKPSILGGGQEFNLRSGTENVAADIGLAAALDKAQSIRSEESARLRGLRDYFIRRLESEINVAAVNGSKEFRLPNNVHASFKDMDNEYLLISLDQSGIMAAAGSACSAAKEESSHVLKALGLTDAQARSSIRFSLGRNTTESDIDRTMTVLSKLVSTR